jgi:hypothetical protein
MFLGSCADRFRIENEFLPIFTFRLADFVGRFLCKKLAIDEEFVYVRYHFIITGRCLFAYFFSLSFTMLGERTVRMKNASELVNIYFCKLEGNFVVGWVPTGFLIDMSR